MLSTHMNRWLGRARRVLLTWEAFCAGVVILAIEVSGPLNKRDVDDILWVLLLPLLFLFGCTVIRFPHMPLTQVFIEQSLRTATWLRSRLALSLGLDFHPRRSNCLPPFHTLRRSWIALAFAAVALLPAQGILREVLAACRVTGLYTVYTLALCLLWTFLLASIVVQGAATFFGILEFVRARLQLEGATRVFVTSAAFVAIGAVLIVLDASAPQGEGLQRCVAALAFACLLPRVVRIAEPPRGPWLNIALGLGGRAHTVRLADLIRDGYQVAVLEAFVVVIALAPVAGSASADIFPATDTLLRLFGWTSVWLYTGGVLLAIGEFSRRRRLYDPAFDRSRVLWSVPGPEASALERERQVIEDAGWRLVIEDRLPAPDDADLLAGMPAGLLPPGQVPLAQVPPSLFLLSDDPGAVLAQVDERDKARRTRAAIERLVTSMRPRMGDRGEGTFLVPHCWLVVGLTRDDDRGSVDRTPAMSFGQSFQAVLGTRLRRFFHEVASRSGVDVLYVEDAVTPQQLGDVLEVLFDRHIQRASPGLIGEQDFVGVQGVRIVLHEVDPEVDGLDGLEDIDAHVTRNAISRARIMIISRDRRDGDDDDDGPPIEGESNDDWLRASLGNMFPRVAPTTG